MKNILYINFLCCAVWMQCSRPIYAQVQNEWTENDSVRLSKMLNGEIPIHINDAFKKELEQSLIGSPMEDYNKYRNDFILDIKLKDDFPKVLKLIDYNAMFHMDLKNNKNLWNGNLKFKGFRINSQTDKNNPFIKVQQNTNISISLGNKFHFNVYGNYTLDKRRSVILPATPIPYSVGAGFSYNIGKNMVFGTQTNYQYNIIQKKWEWFGGLKFTINF